MPDIGYQKLEAFTPCASEQERNLIFFLKGSWPVLNVYRPIPKGVSAQIDSLRGLSALIVLIAHCHQVFISPTYHDLYAISGIFAQSAVMVFFVLSGFLIGKSLTRNASAVEGFNLSRYAIDRANRIYPPLIFSSLLLAALFFIAPHTFTTSDNMFIYSSEFLASKGFELDIASIAGSLFFINGFLTSNISANAPLWSLSYEVWYYIAAGLIFFNRGLMRIIIVMPMLIGLAYLNQAFALYSAVWFSGLAVCILHNNKIFNKKTCLMIGAAFGLSAIALASYYICTFSAYTSPRQIDMKVINLFNFLFGLSFAAIFYLMVNETIKIKPVLRSTSEFSYTLYVTHFPVLLFIYGTTQAFTIGSLTSSVIIGAGSVAACVLMASKVARFVEHTRPFITMKPVPA